MTAFDKLAELLPGYEIKRCVATLSDNDRGLWVQSKYMGATHIGSLEVMGASYDYWISSDGQYALIEFENRQTNVCDIAMFPMKELVVSHTMPKSEAIGLGIMAIVGITSILYLREIVGLILAIYQMVM